MSVFISMKSWSRIKVFFINKEMLNILIIAVRHITHASICYLKQMLNINVQQHKFSKKDCFWLFLKVSFISFLERKISASLFLKENLYLCFIVRVWKWNFCVPLVVLSISLTVSFCKLQSVKKNAYTFQ